MHGETTMSLGHLDLAGVGLARTSAGSLVALRRPVAGGMLGAGVPRGIPVDVAQVPGIARGYHAAEPVHGMPARGTPGAADDTRGNAPGLARAKGAVGTAVVGPFTQTRPPPRVQNAMTMARPVCVFARSLGRR